jgi:hypothetical protein
VQTSTPLRAALLGAALALALPRTDAQITLTQADMPSTGSNYRYSLADTLLFLDPAPAGAGFTWDFSFLSPVAQSEESWVAPTSTDILYFLLFGISNVAQALPVPEVSGFELEDAYQFFQNNASGFRQTAIAGKVGGIPLPIAFDDADIWFRFPMNFGDTDTDASAFELVLPGVASITEERSRANTVDGWGTLITPFGTFDVLRHRSEIDIRDSVSGSLGEFVIERRTIEYRWLGAGAGVPLLQIDVQEVAGLQQVSRIAYQDSLRDLGGSTAIAPVALSAPRLYPNPAVDRVTVEGALSGEAALQPRLLDAGGRVLRQWPETSASGAFRHDLDLDGLPAGRYWLELRAGGTRQLLPLTVAGR